MIFWRRRSIIALVTSFFLAVIAVNVYFVYTILEEKYEPQQQHKVGRNSSRNTLLPVQISFYLTVAVQCAALNGKGRYKCQLLKCCSIEGFLLQVVSKVPLEGIKGSPAGKRSRGKEKFYAARREAPVTATLKAAKKIKSVAEEIVPLYRNVSKDLKFVVGRVIGDLVRKNNVKLNMWKIAEQWVTGTQVLPEKAPLLGNVLGTLCSSQITKADNSRKGTQLKLLLTLEGGQQALFKPQWYPRDAVIEGPVYAGKDRHNAEVAAFHLSLLLNLRRVPLTVGRRVNLRREVVPVATPQLLTTFSRQGNNTCFYGVCLYCEPGSPVCADGDVIEGALIMWLPSRFRFRRYPHPWRRSYNDALVARWEVEEDYCQEIKAAERHDVGASSLLLDLIDAVVLDFLLGNGDRHHYEVPSELNPTSVFLFDNGKGFGNPNVDHLDILAPLYQCCIIRKATLERLKTFTGGALGPSLDQTLKYSHIFPVLTSSHLSALDRRLTLVLAAVEICLRENDPSKVLL